MTVSVVSGARLFRELLCEAVGRAGLQLRAACDRVEALPDTGAGDVVLLHGRAVASDVLADLRQLLGREPRPRVVLIVPAGLDEELEGTLPNGVSAVIPDDSSIGTLVGAAAVIEAGFRLVPAHRDHSVGFPAARPGADGPQPAAGPGRGRRALSPQEARILTRLMAGQSNKDIANALGICETTVKVHLRTCYEKIGARNRTQAALWAASHPDLLG